MLPLAFLLAATGAGLIPLIYLGNRTFEACPQCGRREELAAWIGPTSPGASEIWKQANAADRRRFKRNKLILLAVVLAMFAAALVLFSATC